MQIAWVVLYFIAICGLSGSTILLHITSKKRMIFGEKKISNIKRVLIFSKSFVWNN